MFPAALISDSRDFTLHFHFRCSARANLIDILIHSADAYALVMMWVTQQQNKCAYSSRVSNLTWRNGDIFKITIVCFRFAGISQNQNTQRCRFQERFLRTSSITHLIQQKNIVATGVNLVIEVEHS